MTKSGNNVEVYKKVLLKASELCQGNASAANCSNFKIFESTPNKDLLFKDSTTKLVDISSKSYKEWLGDDYYNSVEGLTTCPKDPSGLASSVTPASTLMLLTAGALVMNFF